MGQLFAVEIIYRGVFQKTLAKNITRGIVLAAHNEGKLGHFLWPLWRRSGTQWHSSEELRHRRQRRTDARGRNGAIRAEAGRRDRGSR